MTLDEACEMGEVLETEFIADVCQSAVCSRQLLQHLRQGKMSYPVGGIVPCRLQADS